MHRIQNNLAMHVVRASTVALAAFGVIALWGFILGWPAIFAVYPLAGVSVVTASGFILVALGLYVTWKRLGWNIRAGLALDHSTRVTRAGALVMLAMALASGVVGLRSLQEGAEEALLRNLIALREARSEMFAQLLDDRLATARLLSTRPHLINLMQAADANPARDGPSAALSAAGASFLTHQFSTLAFYDARGARVAMAGQGLTDPELEVPLAGQPGASLLWRDGFVLRTRSEINVGAASVGTLVTEQPLPAATRLLQDLAREGGSAEIAVCGPNPTGMSCFPLRFVPSPKLYPRQIDGKPLPMSYALDGQTGLVRAQDYRGRGVLAAHGPIGGFGLGMVVKIDSADLYAPVANRMVKLIVALLAIAAAGVWLLRRNVQPLVRELARNETRLRLALSGSRLALWDWNVKTGEVYLSEQWQAMLGNPPLATRVPLEALLELVHPDDRTALDEHMKTVLKGDESIYDIDHRARNAHGDWIWIHSRGEVTERDSSRKVDRLIGTNSDVTERKLAELKSAHEATHDSLTEAANRSLFEDRLSQAIARARREQRLTAIMYVDLDEFKLINDTWGHDAGDAVLVAVTQRLTAAVRESDTVARLGGDEFAIILERLRDADAGRQVAGKIIESMREPILWGEQRLAVTMSIGLAFYAGESETTPAQIRERADEALYRAKNAGRNNFQVAS